MIKERNIINSMLVSTITGEAWEKHLKSKAEAEKKNHPSKTTVAERKRASELETDLETRRANAIKTDSRRQHGDAGHGQLLASAPEFQPIQAG